MGFTLEKVISTHTDPFVCKVCHNLTSLDAVVTTRCSHPFCRDCLLNWTTSSKSKTQCPNCREDLTEDASVYCMELGMITVAARPLEEAQPLAHQVLSQIQVRCSHMSCDWKGDYDKLFEHVSMTHSTHDSSAFIKPIISPAQSPKKKIGRGPLQNNRPNMRGLRSNSLPSLGSLSETSNDSQNASDKPPPRRGVQRTESKRSLDAVLGKSMNLDQLLESDEASGVIFQNSKVADELQTIVSGDTFTEKSASARKKTDEKKSDSPHNKKVESGMKSSDRFLRAFKRQPSGLNLGDEDLDKSYSHALDWNHSLNSVGNLNHSMDSFYHGSSGELHMSDKDVGDGEESPEEQAERRRRGVDKAQKLKKQANAKFNKGDFHSARSLYSEGLRVFSDFRPETAMERELASGMYSNRAVTFFREKKFKECTADCTKAIRMDEKYEKSWIRKWRALIALGCTDEAIECLEDALEAVADKKKIQEELDRTRNDKELIEASVQLLNDGDVLKARELLKPHTRVTDNVNILFTACEIDIALGNVEAALEKANKGLRLNPKHVQGVELRGYTLFLLGDTEKGAHLLQEAYFANKENKKAKLELMHCQKTHAAMTQGRACVKRGRYIESIEHFTEAIEESGPVPPMSPIFAMMRSERAEAHLLLKNHKEALKDCQAVIDVDKENATAWTIRSEVLISLGRSEEARKELSRIRKTWGVDNPTIEEGYKRVDFEMRVSLADENLMEFIMDLENGKTDRLKMMQNSVSRMTRNKSYDNVKSGSLHGRRLRTKEKRIMSTSQSGREVPRGATPPRGGKKPNRRRIDSQDSDDDTIHTRRSISKRRPSLGQRTVCARGLTRSDSAHHLLRGDSARILVKASSRSQSPASKSPGKRDSSVDR